MKNSTTEFLEGTYTYRSWNNLTDLKDPSIGEYHALLFGQGFIRIEQTDFADFTGTIYGTNNNKPSGEHSWSLRLNGSINAGNPVTLRFRGKGEVSGHEWIYNYVGYLILPWPNGIDQKTVLTGSIVRQIPHPGGDGTIHPAGATATWYAVKQ